MCDADHRLGKNGVEEIMEHPFFSEVDWNSIREQRAPFVPTLRSITDTSYFPIDELSQNKEPEFFGIENNQYKFSHTLQKMIPQFHHKRILPL